MIEIQTKQAPIIGISRLRMGTDGHGIRTLVAFHGCSLSCKYCLNPRCLQPVSKEMFMSPEEIMNEIQKDELYYIATEGGITFGGGEPLRKSNFIVEIMKLGADKWNIAVETSLQVGFKDIEMVLPYIDQYIIDIKDMDPLTYKSYTGANNSIVKRNIKLLIDYGFADKIVCRIPLIPRYNDVQAQEKSKEELVQMGIRKFDLFTYNTTRV